MYIKKGRNRASITFTLVLHRLLFKSLTAGQTTAHQAKRAHYQH